MTLTTATLPLDLLALEDAALTTAVAKLREMTVAPALLLQAEAEQQRRQDAARACAAERDLLLAKLTQHLADLEAQHCADLVDLERTPQVEAYPVCRRTYVSGRLAYSLAHDLHGLTGDHAFHRPYGVPDAVVLAGGAAGAAFMRSIQGKPPALEAPWRADLERLRALTGPRASRIANGG